WKVVQSAHPGRWQMRLGRQQVTEIEQRGACLATHERRLMAARVAPREKDTDRRVDGSFPVDFGHQPQLLQGIKRRPGVDAMSPIRLVSRFTSFQCLDPDAR